MCIMEFIENFTEEQLKISSGGLWMGERFKEPRDLYLGKIVSIKDKVYREDHWIPTEPMLNKNLLYTKVRAIEIKDENDKIYHLIPSEDILHYEVVNE